MFQITLKHSPYFSILWTRFSQYFGEFIFTNLTLHAFHVILAHSLKHKICII